MNNIKKILLGSNNPKKYKELKELIENNKHHNLTIYSPKDYNLDKYEIIENGNTFHENALIKAKEYFNQSGVISLSDDSGLIVEALNGEPGIYSARYAGEKATDIDNINYLLQKIKNIDKDKLNAKFITVLCLYDGQEVIYFEGEVKGKLIKEIRGDNGFGYDPIFIPDGYNHTFAELGNETKSQISHRKNALDKFLDYLK